MARIRTIKPEFWTDGAIIALPYEARLFYIGMWNNACDRGHLSDDPLGLKLKILPADPVDGAVLLDMLVVSGRVERVVLPDGRGFLMIPRFTDHQRVDTRWNSRCPVCAHVDSGELLETRASFSERSEIPSDLGESETHTNSRKLAPGGEGKGRERKGREVADATLSPFCKKHPNGTDEPCGACGTARTRLEKAKADAKNKPTPTPGAYSSTGETCPPGAHNWLRDGTCTKCTARRDAA